MLPSRFVERSLSAVSPDLRDVVLELRSLVAKVAPHATERIHPRGFSYFDPQRGGPVSGGICQIAIHKDHIRLAFVHGAFLEDPKRLLEGDRIAKRYVRVPSYADAPWEDLTRLIAESARFDPRTISSGGLSASRS